MRKPISTAHMNGHWRITTILDALHFLKDLVPMSVPESIITEIISMFFFGK
jgi:hypothetical protein